MININKGDRVGRKLQNWIYYQKGHEYNEMHESVSRIGTVIAKSKYGVLVEWDPNNNVKSYKEWIGFNKFNTRTGNSFYGMTSNTYEIYEKL